MRIVILLICLWIVNSGFVAATSAITEQKEVTAQAFQQKNFLISEYLQFLNSNNWMSSGLKQLDENIYLSSLSQTEYLQPILTIHPKDSSQIISKRLLYQSAHLEQISALNDAYIHHYQNSISHYQQALNSFLILKDSVFISSTTFNLSKLYFLKNDFAKADVYIQKAIFFFKKGKYDFNLVDLLLWKTQVNLILNRYNEAENLIIQKILKLKHNLQQEQRCYLLLGKLYLTTHRYTQAKWFFLQAHHLAIKTHQTSAQIIALIYLSKVQNAIRDYNLSLEDLLNVKLLISKTKEVFKLDLFLALAQTYAYLHRTKQSAICLANYKLLKLKITLT